ncbi:MAG: sulfite exporter TauE/SafE family protein [Bdellovibrionota bacterium]|nr:permease [Pseudobdellovibrionaceae bacterium]|tara:strand:- start:74891 stop:75721 length:831 start_codon:yes stop_codon:yes gene_type:complete
MIAYFLASLIGLSLGLLGGGGSILTVPILVYALGMEAKLAIALSLAIVGATSLLGVYGHYKKENVDLKVALIFGPVAMAGTFLGAKLSQFLTGQMQLLLFAGIMLIAAAFMVKDRKGDEENSEKLEVKELNYLLIVAEGIFVGIITGLVGVGGGFLIVPALVLMTGLPMKRAVGTSLLIISLKSFAGFIGYIGLVEIPWDFLLKFTIASAIGIFIGTYLVQFLSQKKLKKAFAVFLIFMGIYILYQNRASFGLAQLESVNNKSTSYDQKTLRNLDA